MFLLSIMGSLIEVLERRFLFNSLKKKTILSIGHSFDCLPQSSSTTALTTASGQLVPGKQSQIVAEVARGTSSGGGSSTSSTATTARPTRSIYLRLLLAFSLRANTERLFNTNNIEGQSITSIHGLKVISMLWIILGHSFSFSLMWLKFGK